MIELDVINPSEDLRVYIKTTILRESEVKE